MAAKADSGGEANAGRSLLRAGAVAGLLGAGLSLAGGCGQATVAVTEELLTLPYYFRQWQVAPSTQPGKPGGRVRRDVRRGDRTFRCVVLANEYLRVRVIPELAGQVHDAVFTPTGDDLFYCEQRAKRDWTFVESGVRVSFPRAEHGTVYYGQPAVYRAFRRPDGSVTLAMWQEFGRNHYANPDRVGLWTHLLLSQQVTLRPGEGHFSVTYRIVNVLPCRVGRQCWNDAFLPRNHTPAGTVQGLVEPPAETLTEWVCPASYVSTHSGQQFRRYTQAEKPLRKARAAYSSVFAWDIPYGFAGLWYPQVRVNRLRLWNPEPAPGTKQFYLADGMYGHDNLRDVHYNFVELWGGTDCVFEAVENWLGPGEAFQFTHRFALVRGIGKVDYADEHVAVSVAFEGPRPCVEAVAFRPVRSLVAYLDGKRLGRSRPCGPDRPARFPMPRGVRGGRVVLVADGEKALDRAFPLAIPPNDARHEAIRSALKHGPVRDEMTGNPAQGGRWDFRLALRGYPAGSVGRGRVLYRAGRLNEAVECLRQAVGADPEDGEAWHLLGAALLESGSRAGSAAAFGEAVRAETPCAAARYFLALDALAGGNCVEAERQLRMLVGRRPAHWEGRLLLAHLAATAPGASAGSLDAARAMEAEDPADPRVQYVLWKGAAHVGAAAAAAAAKAILDRLLTEGGAPRRLAEFQAATRGEYLAPCRPDGPAGPTR